MQMVLNQPIDFSRFTTPMEVAREISDSLKGTQVVDERQLAAALTEHLHLQDAFQKIPSDSQKPP